MTDIPRPDWRGLTEQIRVWQGATFPAVTQEVGKWRTVNEFAEMGKKIASGAPIAEIHEEAADVIITMQHERRAVEFLPYQRTRYSLLIRATQAAAALLGGDIELALMRTMTIFPTEAAAFAEVERKFAIVQKRIWIIKPDGSGQHQELSPAEVKLEKVRELIPADCMCGPEFRCRTMACSRNRRKPLLPILAILDGEPPVDGGADG